MATRHADERAKTGRAFRAYVDLMDTADWLREQMSRQLENFDLTMMEFRVLETLYHEGPQYQQALSRKFRCSKQNVAWVLKQLSEEGWIRRVPGAVRANADGGYGSTLTVAADQDERESEELGHVRGRSIEKMKNYWKEFRPNMYEELDSSGKLHKAAVAAVVEMRGYLAKAAKEGQDVASAMEAARGRYFFLQSEEGKARLKHPQKEKKPEAEEVPKDVVLRLKEHWKRFEPSRHAQLLRSGGLDEAAIKAALQARDAYMKTGRRRDPERAWEEVRKAYRFLPEGGTSEIEAPERERDSRLAMVSVRCDEDSSKPDRDVRDQGAEILHLWPLRPISASLENAGAEMGLVSLQDDLVGGEQATSEPARERGRMGRRVVVLELTPEGEGLIADVFRKHAKVVKAQMRVLEGREQQKLVRLCAKIRRGDVMKFVREMMMEEAEEE